VSKRSNYFTQIKIRQLASMRTPLISFLVCLTLCATGGSTRGAQPSSGPLRVILLSGKNNHNWKETTPKIKAILEDSGRFLVDVMEHPEQLTAETLRPYQVVLSNWNAFSSRSDGNSSWPPIAMESYIQFVRQGGGHVVVHAGSASFPDWQDYQRLTLATWKVGQTTHGRPSAFTVHVAVGHPVTRGLQDFDYVGELWQSPGLQDGATVLASVRSPSGAGVSEEPVAVAGTFGKGRSFTLLLGHDVTEMSNPGFVDLLVRGTFWAASGQALELNQLEQKPSDASNQRQPK
jgi:type 1 glutamine amidotransferase